MIKNQVLNEIKFKIKSGELTYRGIRYLLIRPETIATMQKKGFFRGGFEGASLSASKLKNQGLSPKQVVNKMCLWGTFLGWGNLKLKSFSKNGFSIEVKSSPFAHAYGKSNKPVCKLLCGVFSGIAFVIFQKSIKAKEIKCISKSDKSCLFVVKL